MEVFYAIAIFLFSIISFFLALYFWQERNFYRRLYKKDEKYIGLLQEDIIQEANERTKKLKEQIYRIERKEKCQ